MAPFCHEISIKNKDLPVNGRNPPVFFFFYLSRNFQTDSVESNF